MPSSENSYGNWMCVDRLCTLHLRTLMYALIINLEKNLLSYCVLGYLGKERNCQASLKASPEVFGEKDMILAITALVL